MPDPDDPLKRQQRIPAIRPPLLSILTANTLCINTYYESPDKTVRFGRMGGKPYNVAGAFAERTDFCFWRRAGHL